MALMFGLARVFMHQGAARRVVGALLGRPARVVLRVAHELIGIEWFMSIERPWFSTLLGAFVMVSGFLAGICACALIIFSWRGRTDAAAKLIQKSAQRAG